MEATKFTDWLKDERKRRGITQRDLSELSGVHHSTIAKMEQGISPPTAEFVVKITEALGSTPTETANHLYDIGVRKTRVGLGDAGDDWYLAKCRRYTPGAPRETT